MRSRSRDHGGGCAWPGWNLRLPDRVLPGVTESPGRSSPDDDPSPDHGHNALRPGPLWRHALWVVGVTALGVGFAWLHGASYDYPGDAWDVPPPVPGQVWPYLMAWTAIGLAAATVLRAGVARAPLYCPEVLVVAVTFVGTRFSLGFRPEPPVLAATAAAVLTAAVTWCAVERWCGTRGDRLPGAASGGRGGG